jgi:hypothetical protein
LLGKKKGESAKIKTPAGEIEFEIIDIGLWFWIYELVYLSYNSKKPLRHMSFCDDLN